MQAYMCTREKERDKVVRKEREDGRRTSESKMAAAATAVQSSTGKSVGPLRCPSLLLIPTAVLRLYLVPPSSHSATLFALSHLLWPLRSSFVAAVFLFFSLLLRLTSSRALSAVFLFPSLFLSFSPCFRRVLSVPWSLSPSPSHRLRFRSSSVRR